jgi:hypothetical protein
MLETTERNVTMTHANTITEKAYLVGTTIIAMTIIYISWGFDAPMGNFALVFGGSLLGHVLTEVLNAEEKEEGLNNDY